MQGDVSPHPKQFLDAKVALMIEDLKKERIPGPGERAMSDKKGMSIKDKVLDGSLKVT
jgi:hypothetical protein